MNYNLETQTWSNEKLYMARILEKNKLSLNVGLNERLIGATAAYKTNLPLSLHSGITKPIDVFFDWNYKPGIFLGVEFRF